MAGPWDEYQNTKQAGPWEEYAAPAEMAAPSGPNYDNMSLLDRIKNDASQMGKLLTPIPRGLWKGVSSLPTLAMDMGVSARNHLTGENYELPSQMQERGLDAALPLPNVGGARALEFGTSLLSGMKLPVPQAAKQAPKGFVKPSEDLVRQQTLVAGQKAGFVVPPSTTNPSIFNKFLESLGGKVATAQDAAVKNQEIFNKAGKSALGLSKDAALTQEGMSALRAEAGDVYGMLKGAGKIVTDSKYADDLAKVGARFSGASKDFPELAKSEVTDLIAGAGKKEFSSDSAVDLLSILRDKADKAYAGGDKGLGKAYKEVSKSIEDVIERNLAAAGNSTLMKQFKDARQLIAKTYSVESAFNPSTGNVVGTKLAAQLAKKKPLSGDLKTAAQFAQAFPRASQAITDSGAVRNTDVILGAGASALSREPAYLMYPFARQAARSFLLSGQGQKLATKGATNGPPSEALMAAFIAAEQARLGK